VIPDRMTPPRSVKEGTSTGSHLCICTACGGEGLSIGEVEGVMARPNLVASVAVHARKQCGTGAC
jgi:hypothetical protein